VPRLGIVLGSGLGGLASELVADRTTLPFESVAGFPAGAVAGHAREVSIGTVEGVGTICLAGRAHLYEGLEPAQLAEPIRALRVVGVDRMLLSSAVGSLRPELGPGALLAIADHINLQARNPLVGPNDERVGPRFVSMRDAYDPGLRAALLRAAEDAGVVLTEGVYAATLGPMFETPAEVRMLRLLGAHAAGMSVVPEAIAARHCGLRVAGLAVVTNLAEGIGDAPIDHEGTLSVAARVRDSVGTLIRRFAAISDE
jgi:xanthosine phosphorylase